MYCCRPEEKLKKKAEEDRKKRREQEKKDAEREQKRLKHNEKLKLKLNPCIKACEKIVLKEHEPSLADIDKCIHDLKKVTDACKANDFSDAQVLMAQEYLNRKTDPLGLFILREKRVKMDEAVEKLVNKKLLDDAKNEEISLIEAEHDSPWNIKSIVGFFGGAFSTKKKKN